MSKLVIALAATAVVVSSFSASAADLPAPAPLATPIYDWTGCYMGVQAGAGINYDTWTTEHGIGALAGGQLGCDYQTGMLVLGIQGEGFWSGMQSTYSDNDPSDSNYFETAPAKNTWDADIAARFGLGFDRALLYGKVGAVVGHFNFSVQQGSNFGTDTGTASSTLPGLLLGLGLEYALTTNWAVLFEYDYLGFPAKVLYVNNISSGVSEPYSASYGANENLFKLGVDYRFGWGNARN